MQPVTIIDCREMVTKATSRAAVAAALALAMAVGGCQSTNGGPAGQNEVAGTIIGAALGGIAGGALGGRGGAGVAGAIAGAAIGGLIGNQIGAALDEADRRRHEQVMLAVLNARAPVNAGGSLSRPGVIRKWSNPAKKTSGTVQLLSSQKNGTQDCKTLSHTITVNGSTTEQQTTHCRQAGSGFTIAG